MMRHIRRPEQDGFRARASSLLLHASGSQRLPAGIVVAARVPGGRVHRLVANETFEKENVGRQRQCVPAACGRGTCAIDLALAVLNRTCTVQHHRSRVRAARVSVECSLTSCGYQA